MYTSGYGYNSTPTHYFIVVSGPARVAVVEEGGVALHQGEGELLEEVGDGDGLLFPSVTGKRAAQLFDLFDRRFVPATKTLHCKWQEDNPLLVAGLPRLVKLPLMRYLEGVAGGLCSLCHCGCLEGVDHSDIESCIFSSCMSGDEDVGRFPPLSWEQVLALLGRSQLTEFKLISYLKSARRVPTA